MTADEFDRLLDLHRAAVEAQGRAACRLIPWREAHDADDAFVGYAQSLTRPTGAPTP